METSGPDQVSGPGQSENEPRVAFSAYEISNRSKPMFKHGELTSRLSRPTMILASLFLAACGGGSDQSGAVSQTGAGNSFAAGVLCLAYLLVSGNDECVTSGVSGSSGSSGATGESDSVAGSSPPPSSSPGSPIRIRDNSEYEPNDDLINANPVWFASTTDKAGFYVDGTIDEAGDPFDVFLFVAPRARDLRFQLCPPGQLICERSGGIDSLTAYFDVLDQDGNVLLSSQAANFNVKEMPMEAGVPYYARVVAGDTMAAAVGYRLTAYERN